IQAKRRRPSISLATIYNCLDTLVECGLVKQVNMEREATRYCPNLEEHGHFHCTSCGKIFDVPLNTSPSARTLWKLPKGFRVHSVEVTLRGTCADCQNRSSRRN
ncbi:MAG: transcriptional repressor, partial [Verrucomicrobiia bacterium]